MQYNIVYTITSIRIQDAAHVTGTHTTRYKYTGPYIQIQHKPKYNASSTMRGKTLA